MTNGLISLKNNVGDACYRQGGFTLFELMVVLVLLSGMYYVVIDRLMYYRTQYESAEITWTIAAIRTSRQVEMAVLDSKLRSYPSLHEAGNPMRLLSRLPHNYIGEKCNPDPTEVERGSWYFDKCNFWLVYVYNSEKIFAPEYPKILKFNVESLRLLTDPARTF